MSPRLTSYALRREIAALEPGHQYWSLPTSIEIEASGYGRFQVVAVRLQEGSIVLEAVPLPIGIEEALDRG